MAPSPSREVVVMEYARIEFRVPQRISL
jgi:hypothetical protein